MTTVSVIVPTYNRPDLLQRALESVLGQTYEDFECLVVDDGPSAETREMVESFEDDRLTYLRHETNQGASAARNTGLEHARGEFIAFLDDDDEWLPNKLEHQVPLLDSAPNEVGFVYCWMRYYDGDTVVNTVDPTLRGDVFADVLDTQRLAGCPTLLIRQDLVDDVGGFNEDLPRGNDGEFIRRLCRAAETDLVPEVLVNVYVDHGHERISREDETGKRNAVKALEHYLVEFEDGFDRYPAKRANLYGKLGNRHGELGEWWSAARYHGRSIQSAPLSPVVYGRLVNSAMTAAGALRTRLASRC